MASGGEKNIEDKEKNIEDKDIDEDNETPEKGKEKKDKGQQGGSDDGAMSWVMSGIKLGAALKLGAILGVTTLGATGVGALAIGAYAALKLTQQDGEEPPEEEDCGSNSKEVDDKSKEPPSLASPGSENDEKPPTSNLVDELNELYQARVTASAAKRSAVKDLVEKARQPLSSSLMERYESLIEWELTPAALDSLITRQTDERRLMLPLLPVPEMWEINAVTEMPGFFTVHRANLDSFGVGASQLDTCLSGSYLSPELLGKFWVENIKQLLREEKLFGFESSLDWESGCIELKIENPIKGYADMLCLKIVPCMRFKKDGVLKTITAESVTPSQKPPALSGIPLENMWRQSWEERAVLDLKTLDKDGGCRTKCLAIMDALQSSCPHLKMLSIYHMMTVLLKLCEEETEWEDEMLAERLLDLLKALEGYLATGSLTDYYDDKVDILAQVCSPEAASESHKWLAGVLESKNGMSDLFHDIFK